MKLFPNSVSHAWEVAKDIAFPPVRKPSASGAIAAAIPGPSLLPASTTVNTSAKDGIVFVSEPRGEAADQYRRMANAILQGPWPRRRILITSPASGDGKTLTSVNLALAIAERGESVFLAELNLVRPRYRYVFGSPSTRGVETALLGECTPEQVTFQLGATRVSIASVAAPMPNNLLLEEQLNLNALLEYGEKNFRWSILDVPPMSECARVRNLAAQAGPVVMVARSGKTKLNGFRRAAVALGSDLDYVLLNDVA